MILKVHSIPRATVASRLLPLLLAVLFPALAVPQMRMGGGKQTFVKAIESHASSGTSAEPNSTPAPMLMTMRGDWMLMFHANAFVADTQQSGPRGKDKFFSTNWVMPMAQRAWGPGQLTLRAMFSLEPATITGREYPLLFQQGETAFGQPIVDGQHPHNFVMELGALYDWRIGRNALLSFYGAPVGDPAIGPTAFPHRASAMEDPVAALGHHQEDSTHIAADVVTVGVTKGIVRLEASGFHGREPDEHRWKMPQGAIDSWSGRLTVQPGENWSGQYSYAFIRSPEQLAPLENQRRMTASVMYNRPFGKGNWASSAVWGRTRTGSENLIENSFLFESLVRFATRNSAYTRLENVDRTTELLLDGGPEPPGFEEGSAGRVQAYTFGYDRDFDLVPHLSSALGAQVTAYSPGSQLKGIYGADPVGVTVFLRFRPFGVGR
ncbi:MAG: hypothetical protein WBD10_05905 [Acidobacteriaceae bacterium]